MRYLAVITLLVLTLAMVRPVAAQSFKPDNNAGVAAYKRGDYARAVQHFRPLANHGHAGAQYNLGVAFDEGLGVTKDPKQAVRWYRKAANQGYAHAQANLGATYFTGNGVLKDHVMAYVWYNVAAANGKSKLAPKSRNFIGQRLSQSDLKKAQKLSKLCLKKPAKCPEYSDD